MKTRASPQLLSATVVGLCCIFAFFAWRYQIEQSTFLTRRVLHTLLVAGFILGLCLAFIIKKWGKGERIQGIMENIKLCAGTILIVGFFCYILITTVVWLLPGTMSTYSATSDFSSRTRYGCSGAYVDDPDLNRRIKICDPVGYYFDGRTLRVTKRSNALGMTIVYAVATH
ncbi:hypothetical protein EHW65_18100 [Erwinia psidii]|uniref:hypothetical protein n=1 Tax=Erwinia psidii TaxID=69224 RepID=UPI00226BBCF1|nr:hypothetical protein [Erwinia psidii]MCX8959073.1 hypothetical protein [Erwinia psidii]